LFKGICCPHYDEEPARRPYVKDKLVTNEINQCIGIEGHAALHIINEESYKSVNFGINKNSYIVNYKDNLVEENSYESLNI
jgi:aminopeptidase N